jgi:ubiquinone/menaquinone biosynthesis C-methylase UbiE
VKNESEIKKLVQDQFGHNALKYVTSESHAKGKDLQLVGEWLQPKADWRALDVATGGGHVAKVLSECCHHVVATDLTKSMLEVASNHLKQHKCENITFVVADAENLPFLDQTFDAVTCRIAAHHFPNPKRFLQEVSRVLKNDGKFLFIDNVAPEPEPLNLFMNTFEQLRDESHVKCRSVNEWTEWAAKAGLVVEISQIHRKTYDFPSWVERTARSKQQIQEVEKFILEADPLMHDYFSVVIENGRISTLQVDEWRVLFRKKS